MTQFVLRRILQGMFSILGASLIIFIITRLSGDPVVLMLPPEAPQSMVDQMRERLGLDLPIWQQYLRFLGDALTGDFGNSYRWEMPVRDLILQRLPATIYLASAALVFSLMLSIPFGVLSARHRGSWFDRFAKAIAMLGQAMPNFWVRLLLIVVFSIHLQWLPAFGNDTRSM
ncbi:MAG: ABC transporter permease [Paracoccaceae bacterium]